MAKSIYFFLLCFLFGTFYSAIGQDQRFFSFRNYNQSAGLSSYNITKIIRDNKGFTWIGTQDGLNCFDGKSFKVYNKEYSVGFRLGGNNVTDIIEDRKRDLIWLSTSYGGIQCINLKTQRVKENKNLDRAIDRIKGQWIHCLIMKDDILWIGTHKALYAYDLSTEALKQIYLPQSITIKTSNISFNKLSCINNIIIAMCEGYGVLCLDAHSLRITYQITSDKLNFFDAQTKIRFWNSSIQGYNRIYITTNWGLRILELHDNTLKVRQTKRKLPFFMEETFACISDQDGTIWISNSNGLFQSDTSFLRIVKISDANNESDTWLNGIYTLFSDDEHNIWVGSEEGLSYYQTNKKSFDKFYSSFNSILKLQHVFSIYPSSDSIVYCGTTNGLYKLNTKTHFISKIQNGSSYYLINKVASNKILVSNNKGLYILKNNEFYPVTIFFPEFKKLQHESFSSYLAYNDSIFLFGSQLYNGLYVWNKKSKSVKLFNNTNKAEQIENNIINSIYKDRDGHVWILSESSLCLFNPLNNTFHKFYLKSPNNNESCKILFDMVETKNRFWFAAYGLGLIETDKQLNVKRIINEHNGLCNNGVYKVFAYKDSLILATSNNGLSILDIKNQNIKNYFESDGLHSNAFEQFCGYANLDRIYSGGVSGITIIQPDKLKENTSPPKLYITSIHMDTKSKEIDTTNLEFIKLNIPNYVSQTTINFSGLNFSNPDRTVYAYKINGLTENWTYLGNRNSVNLIGLGPGTYSFMVKAANEDGYWSEPKNMIFVIEPKWYQTIWFKGIMLLFAISAAYAIYAYRISQIKAQHLIRKNIASDLHDDIGSTLNTVKVFTHLAKQDYRKSDYLNKIEDSLIDATAGLRDMLWVLDDSNDTTISLVERIKRFALPICNANEISFECKTDIYDPSQILPKTEKRNLLLMSKEIINNSIKYAECSEIQLLVQQNKHKKSFIIKDNGNGFESSNAFEGNGLKNLYYRAEQIGYKVEIVSSIGNGTTIKIEKNTR